MLLLRADAILLAESALLQGAVPAAELFGVLARGVILGVGRAEQVWAHIPSTQVGGGAPSSKDYSAPRLRAHRQMRRRMRRPLEGGAEGPADALANFCMKQDPRGEGRRVRRL